MIFKNDVLPAWELNFRDFLFFCVFCVFWGHLKNSSFTCMGAQFWRSRSAILRFFVIFEKAKKTVFRQGPFFTFFHHFWCLLGGLLALFWRPFGVSVVSLACRCPPLGCLWLVWAVRGPSMGSLCCFLWCLWLVRAVFGPRGPLRDRFLLHFWTIFAPFSKDSGVVILKPF